MTTQIDIGYRDTQTHPHHWRELPPDFIINRPCVIVLGGSSTNTPLEANGYIKLVEQMAGVAGVPESDRSFDIIAPYYAGMEKENAATGERYLFLVQKGCASDTSRTWAANLPEADRHLFENPPYIRNLYERLLRPLITQNNGSERLPAEQVTRNLNRVHFVSHSHGSFVVLKLQDIMDQEMARLGYHPAERRRLFSRMTWIDCAGAQVPYGFSQMDTLHFSSFNDEELIKGQNAHHSLTRLLDEKYMATIAQDKNIVLPVSDTEHLWLTCRFSNQTGGYYQHDAEHAFEPFVKGAWKPMDKAGRQVAFMAAAVLQANLSEALRQEAGSVDHKPWYQRIGNNVCYRQGPHVLWREKPKTVTRPVLSASRLPTREECAEKLNQENRLNITADRLSIAQKITLADTARRKGQKYDTTACVTNLNQVIRDKAADDLKQKTKADRRAAASAFHQHHPYYRTALKQGR